MGNVRQKRWEEMKIGYVRVSKQEQHEALQTAQFPSENDQYSAKLW
jgi:hypothetical protein